MADRPFRGANYGGIAPLGEGINQGVNSFVQNYLAMKRLQMADKYADIAGRREAVIEGQLRGQTAPIGQPPVDVGGGGAAVLATQPPSPTDMPPSAQYIETQPGVPLPQENDIGHPYFRQSPGANPGVGTFPPTSLPGRETDTLPGATRGGNYRMQADPVVQPPPDDARNMTPGAPAPMQLAQAGPVGAQALASAVDKPVEEMSLDELRNLSFEHATKAREDALANETDLEMLGPAFHYKAQMNLAKPYLDQWAKALNEVKANPQNPDKWRGVQVLTGEDDPQKALALATKEYSTLRGQYEEYGKNYTPLNEQLTKRGITPEMYGDEAKYLQFKNRRKFQPHSPSGRGAGVMKTPKTTRR